MTSITAYVKIDDNTIGVLETEYLSVGKKKVVDPSKYLNGRTFSGSVMRPKFIGQIDVENMDEIIEIDENDPRYSRLLNDSRRFNGEHFFREVWINPAIPYHRLRKIENGYRVLLNNDGTLHALIPYVGGKIHGEFRRYFPMDMGSGYQTEKYDSGIEVGYWVLYDKTGRMIEVTGHFLGTTNPKRKTKVTLRMGGKGTIMSLKRKDEREYDNGKCVITKEIRYADHQFRINNRLDKPYKPGQYVVRVDNIIDRRAKWINDTYVTTYRTNGKKKRKSAVYLCRIDVNKPKIFSNPKKDTITGRGLRHGLTVTYDENGKIMRSVTYHYNHTIHKAYKKQKN